MTTTLAPAPGEARPAAGTNVPSRPRAPGLDFLLTAVFALFGLAVGIARLADNSFFTHLATGRWILDHGIPREDFYSFTAPGTKWIAQSWLAEALYAQLDRSFGAFGIRVFVALVAASISVLVFRLALRLVRERVRAALIALLALAGLFALWSERPLVLGVLAFVVLLWIVEVPDCRIGRHPLVALPMLFWLWANVHGTFALGFAYLGLHLLGRWLDGARPWEGRERTLLLGSAIAFAVCFANPYGPALVVFPVDLLSRGHVLENIVEWASPDFRDLWGQAFLLWIAVFVCAVARGRNRVSRRDLVVTIPFLLLALWALRNIAVAPLVGLPVVARAVALDPEEAEARQRGERPGLLSWALLVVLAVGAFGLLSRAADQPDFATAGYPVRAMQALEERDLIGTRLLMDDGDAAYAELAYPGEQPVFLDDRYDMFPVPVIEDYLALADATPHWERIFRRYDVETVVWPKDHPLARFLADSGDWAEIHRDRHWVAFVRDDLGS